MFGFLGSVGAIFGMMVLIAAIETVVPLRSSFRQWRSRIKPNLVLMTMTFLVNFALTLGATVLAVKVNMHDLAVVSFDGLPAWAILPVAIVFLDFFAYLAHWSMHKIDWLWRVHRVHHSDLFVDVTTSYRQHPIEGLWRFPFMMLPVWALGIPVEAFLIYRFISASFALFEHANIGLWYPLERALSNIFVTPNFHKIHHSRLQVETDSNYGNIFSFHDRLLRTITPITQSRSIDYGLNGYNTPELQSSNGLLLLPFAKS